MSNEKITLINPTISGIPDEIILMVHKDGWARDLLDTNETIYLSFENLMKRRYQIKYSQEILTKIKCHIILVRYNYFTENNQRPVKYKFELLIDNSLRYIEATFISMIDKHILIIFRKISNQEAILSRTVEIQERIKLTNTHVQILEYISQQNQARNKPNRNEINRYIGFSRPTTRKKIGILLMNNLIKEIKNGREKNLELTELGQKYLI